MVERIDGVAVLKCEELLERFRLCADGCGTAVLPGNGGKGGWERSTRDYKKPRGGEARAPRMALPAARYAFASASASASSALPAILSTSPLIHTSESCS